MISELLHNFQNELHNSHIKTGEQLLLSIFSLCRNFGCQVCVRDSRRGQLLLLWFCDGGYHVFETNLYVFHYWYGLLLCMMSYLPATGQKTKPLAYFLAFSSYLFLSCDMERVKLLFRLAGNAFGTFHIIYTVHKDRPIAQLMCYIITGISYMIHSSDHQSVTLSFVSQVLLPMQFRLALLYPKTYWHKHV